MQVSFDLDNIREAANTISIINHVHTGLIEALFSQGGETAAPQPAPDANPAPAASEQKATLKLVTSEPEVKYTQDDVNKAIQDYAQRVSFPAASALLKEFGVNRATELPESKRAEFIARSQS